MGETKTDIRNKVWFNCANNSETIRHGWCRIRVHVLGVGTFLDLSAYFPMGGRNLVRVSQIGLHTARPRKVAFSVQV